MRVFLTFTALAVLLATPSLAADLTISDISVIPIHDGVNTIDHFTADGRTATVFRAWRDNGNAHGHDVYLVSVPLQQQEGIENSAGVVAFDDQTRNLADTITASPFDGERRLASIRFARALVDGKRETVVIDAELGVSKSGVLADHAPAGVSVYVLKSPGVGVGTTPDVFMLAFKVRAVGLYCNADMALHQTLGLPLPADYAGGKAPGGCLN